ncbi:DUF418 domain-containing protein [Brevibacillus reuszeri]|uniref:DUF418 domain-containing protein n=1 Tax=Brevibacillus reuszeri TaxID=54915 RepID=UPI003D250B76
MRGTPVLEADRIHQLDGIRGFALFGILLVNMPTFLHPVLFLPANGLAFEHSTLDEWIRLFFDMFVQTKFYTIFSFLFGAGFYLFMNRAEQKGLPMNAMFLRRISVLFLLGVIHLGLFWYGDILHTYAIAGNFLLFFNKGTDKTIRNWAWSLLMLIQLLYALLLFIPSDPSVVGSESHAIAQKAVAAYSSGSWGEWIQFRFAFEFPIVASNEFLAILTVLPLFLFGLLAARRGVFTADGKHRTAFRRMWWVTLILSIVLISMIPLVKKGIVQFPAPDHVASIVFVGWSGLTLSVFYICSFILLYEKAAFHKGLRHLEAVGRMALSNYLGQTIVTVGLVMVFKLYGTLSLGVGLIYCLVLFSLQILASKWWLSHYQFGPVEWLWRCLTYARWMPMKRNGGNYEI